MPIWRENDPIPPSDHPAWLIRTDWGQPDPADPPGKLPDQVAAARDALLAGTSPLDVRQQLSTTFKQKAQPTKALRNAIAAIEADEELRGRNLGPIIQAMRFSAIQRALAMGQVGPAAALLRDVEAAAAHSSGADGGQGLSITIEAHAPEQRLPEAGPVSDEQAAA